MFWPPTSGTVTLTCCLVAILSRLLVRVATIVYFPGASGRRIFSSKVFLLRDLGLRFSQIAGKEIFLVVRPVCCRQSSLWCEA